MGTLCDTLIKSDIAFACDDAAVRGLEGDGIIINRKDIDFAATVFDDKRKNIIKTMALRPGKKGYAVQQLGNSPFTGTKSTLEVGTYRNTWQHEIPIAVLANSPDVAESVIDGLANGSFVVILRNKHKGADGSAEFQVYGYAQGLTVSAGENDKYSEDTDGGWLMTLQEKSAPKSALFYFNTDVKTTEAQFESLKTETAGK